MSDTSGKTYKELASLHFGEVFELIEEICREKNIPIYLIGAHARIIQHLKQGIQPMRGTGDIDFAIMIPDFECYDIFITELEKVGFSKTYEPYRLIYDKTETIVDILPFGQIEERGTIKFTDRKTELSVIGMKEVLDSAINIKHEGFDVNLPPLVGIMILKLVSWKEKPDRTKDLDDIYEIINNYFETAQASFYKNHLNIIDELNTDSFMLESGAFMIGKEMGDVIKKESFLRNLILGIIQKEIDEEPGSISLYFLQHDYFKNYGQIKRIFMLIHKGLNDK